MYRLILSAHLVSASLFSTHVESLSLARTSDARNVFGNGRWKLQLTRQWIWSSTDCMFPTPVNQRLVSFLEQATLDRFQSLALTRLIPSTCEWLPGDWRRRWAFCHSFWRKCCQSFEYNGVDSGNPFEWTCLLVQTVANTNYPFESKWAKEHSRREKSDHPANSIDCLRLFRTCPTPRAIWTAVFV